MNYEICEISQPFHRHQSLSNNATSFPSLSTRDDTAAHFPRFPLGNLLLLLGLIPMRYLKCSKDYKSDKSIFMWNSKTKFAHTSMMQQHETPKVHIMDL